MFHTASARVQRTLRIALGHDVLNGIAVAVGLLLVSGVVHLWLGAFAASAATVGVIVSVPPDRPAPRRGKLWQMLPAPLLGTPLFFAGQWLHDDPLALGLLLVPATFFTFLGMAWGKRGAPVAISLMFAMVFSMAVPLPSGPGTALASAFSSTLYFGLGALLYLPFLVLANQALNARYRVQLLADVLLSLAALMRLQARQFTLADDAGPASDGHHPPSPLTGVMLHNHAELADQLQGARDVILESPRTVRRQRLASMLVLVLEMRDHLLACELDLDSLRAQPGQAPTLAAQQAVLLALADEVERLADALLWGRQPMAFTDLRARLQMPTPQPPSGAAPDMGFTPALLARGLANRMGYINDEALRLIALARGEALPDLAVVRTNWQMFVSPTTWSWQPLRGLWRWDAPPLRHAVRAALALGVGYALARQLPWGTHAYWVLLTIVVVLRGSLAQTLERRNLRVAGTLLGCVLAVAVLSAQWPHWGLLLVVVLAQALAHGLALRRYLVTAVAATVLGLVQAHLLNTGGGTALALFERLVDTLLGTGIAWAFAYVLPSWERTQMAALVARTLAAHAHHTRVALSLGQLQAVDNSPELAWRLARREAYDSLSALVQATQRSLAEPRAVRPPLVPLEHLQVHSYQLLAQLTAVKTLLLLRRGRLPPEQVQGPLALAAERIGGILLARTPPAAAGAPVQAPWPEAEPLPGPLDNDLSPWLLRRLHLAIRLATQLRVEADQVLAALEENQKR